MSCQQVRPESIQAYLDKEFPANEHSEIEKHIVDCVSCKATIGQLQGISNLLSDVPIVETSLDYLFRLQTRLGRDKRKRIFYTRLTSAVAAVILIGIGVFSILNSGVLFQQSLKFVNNGNEDKYVSISESIRIKLTPRSEIAFIKGDSRSSYGTLELNKGEIIVSITSPLAVPISIWTEVDSFEVSNGEFGLCLLNGVPNTKGILVNYY
ncbi:MAG: hypothetical protein A2W05_10620 [Candidatus Schekmanbacteria bacterium RBG_16_38_10]|uniref:Zinc-finger domain-containing protein n=1 Tax=Candidatus Schekmanbacteria bacterium RBG_16_38_10 TaxID=1817879 RepID=A0A1F7S1U5_9BACT|nr:MAG: hypothetical protein A2W05_10620 [Candidatus Schekmanbacteria bacterium RBG_16_38_10]